MKSKWKVLYAPFIILAGAIIALHLSGGAVFAEETAGGWRKSYDVIMVWVNFGILAFVVVKFGKNPLMNFLKMQRDEVAVEISELEAEKAVAMEKINEARRLMAESDARFAELKETIVRMGEKRRQDLIDDAKQESAFMMSMAEQKVGGYILAARKAFKGKLIDASIKLAMSRLPQHITEEDNQRIFDKFLSTVSRKLY